MALTNQTRVLIAFLGWMGGARRGDHDALRNTWLAEAKQYPNLDYRFFIGDGTPLPPDEDRMINEQYAYWAKNGSNAVHVQTQNKLANTFNPASQRSSFEPREDEILIPYPDGYQYLSYKRRESLRWALAQGYEYIFCASVDVYARPDRLLASDFRKYDYHGLYCGNTGFRGTDNYIPESYIFGGGYWLSAKGAERIVNAPVTYWCEDWWVGLVLRDAVRAGEIIRNDARVEESKYCFTPRYPNIDNDLISVELSAGGYSLEKMFTCHAQFTNPCGVTPNPGRGLLLKDVGQSDPKTPTLDALPIPQTKPEAAHEPSTVLSIHRHLQDACQSLNRVRRRDLGRPVALLQGLKLWRDNPIPNGILLDYYELARRDQQQLRASISFFGNALLGFALPRSAQTQEIWTAEPDSIHGKPGSWCMAALMAYAYDTAIIYCIDTAGRKYQLTWEFWKAYCDESYVLLIANGYVHESLLPHLKRARRGTAW